MGLVFRRDMNTKMAKPSGAFSSTAIISEDFPPQHLNQVVCFLHRVGISDPIPDRCNTKDYHSALIHGILKPLHIRKGRVTCLVSVKPAVAVIFRCLFSPFFVSTFAFHFVMNVQNIRGGFHGGAIAAVAETVSIACARTVVAEDKEIFLGELSISYLSAAPKNAELIGEGSVVKSGRNLSVIAVDFKLKETQQLAYTARATFYHTPIAKL
ncbi:uncharacterized protein [Malus domestica]|uniref:uncharacterized protein isoform X1 n=1 Tax=Malus domestica TaxID=3750 RepID=UPI0010AA8BCE|nr:uncharacterized protein LOC103431940 isoform X1 [Malus domestica]